jgi:single-stranded-DNA-specific exonuclease
MKYWSISKPNIKSPGESLSEQILKSRGISREFTDGGEISDPYLMADMEKAVDLIKSALINGDKIMIFGDYDCDGVTSTVILHQYLTAQGGEADWYIPSRDEGYGLNTEAIDKIAEKNIKLLITVDTGISSADEAAYIKEKGISLIITDHHTPPEILPEADAIINPKLSHDTSPFKDFAGCGVVLKLIMALENDIMGVLEQFADLAAIGTIGDVVPLFGENRIIVKHGLEIMPYTENLGLYKLLKQSGFSNDEDNGLDPVKLTAHALSFTVCPRINAAGRFAHAGKAAELLLCENDELAGIKAAELSELNNTRREAETEILNQVNELISANPAMLSERMLVLRGENWHKGVIGIVSSRVLTKWGKPNIIITDDGETLRASARSIDDFPLFPLLKHCTDYLYKFGGHVKAAGFTASHNHYDDLVTHINNYTAENYPDMPYARLKIDKILEPSDLTLENVAGLDELAPFGEGNPVPLFLMQNCVIISKKALKDGKYLSFNVRMENIVQKILCFTCSYDDFGYDVGQAVDILVTLNINEYNNTRSVSAQMKALRVAGFNQDRHFAALSAYESLVRGEEISPNLSERVIPAQTDIKIVYDILRKISGSIDRIYNEAMTKNINYCKFRIILDVLNECGLIKYNLTDNTVKLNTVSEKVNLEDSETLCKVRALAGVNL